MTDIVARLRGRGVATTLELEAADELDKLVEYFRGDGYGRFGWNGDVQGWSPAETAIHAMREAAAEIERLWRDLANECERRDEIIASETHLRKEADAEIERLRASEAAWEETRRAVAHLNNENAALRGRIGVQ